MLKAATLNKALKDLTDGVGAYRIWFRLALMETKIQYRRSVLGPFWFVLSTLFMVLAYGILYGTLLQVEISSHLPYVACGLVIWTLYSDIILKGCQVFIQNGRMIQQLPLPLSVYLFKLVCHELIVFAHNISVIVLIFVFLLVSLSWQASMAVISLAVVVANGFVVGLIFGIVSTRFRDFMPIVHSFMRPMLFLTPIIWHADAFPERSAYVWLNPFFHVVEIFRAPLLGEAFPTESFLIVVIFTILFFVVSLLLFSKYRHRIVYWV